MAQTIQLCMQVQVERQQMPCHLTRTTPETHRLIQDNLEETPVYGGWVDSKGPRYCPSIEDKIVRFKDKDSHQVGCLPSKPGEHASFWAAKHSLISMYLRPVLVLSGVSQTRVMDYLRFMCAYMSLKSTTAFGHGNL